MWCFLFVVPLRFQRLFALRSFLFRTKKCERRLRTSKIILYINKCMYRKKKKQGWRCVTEDGSVSALQPQAWWNYCEIKPTVPLNACAVDQREWQKVLNVCRLCNSRKTNKHVTECLVISEKKKHAWVFLFERQKPPLVGKKLGREVKSLLWLQLKQEEV